MRTVHFSDIHLSKANIDEFQNNLKDALIKDLLDYHQEIPIDLIVITGDLVDKGGHSLLDMEQYKDVNDPYLIFEQVFINPIADSLGIPKGRFLFVPGNHDVDMGGILLQEESELLKITDQTVTEYIRANRNFKFSGRIKRFKEFEQRFHKDNRTYKYSPNQSTYIYTDRTGIKVGFLLLNDSWRCKSIKLENEDGKHYVGAQQAYDGIRYLDTQGSQLNISLLHHPMENFKDGEEIKGIFQRKNIELFLYGHFHATDTNILYTPHGDCKGFRARATLFKPEEKNVNYQSGYQILDIDLNTFMLTRVHYRRYSNSESAKCFVMDVDTAPDKGIDSNKGRGFELVREGRTKKAYDYLDESQFKS